MPDEEFSWYYVGRFGQLGPLSVDQMQDLVRDSVIQRDTYVWKIGMENWVRAATVSIFFLEEQVTPPYLNPPQVPRDYSEGSADNRFAPPPFTGDSGTVLSPTNYDRGYSSFKPEMATVPYSDKSKIAAGVLNIVFPGIGRIYAGHVGTGLLMILTSFCFGIGYIWSLIDGILYLVGTNKVDSRGRPFRN
jgi:TM2 domain-containing membrane protein YozV